MDDEQHRRASGSVPHAYGNAVARRWAPELPRPLTGGFLTLLYVLRAMASADGRLRYERDGAPITIAQIATACRSDQKDVRLYLKAAVAAGVVAVLEDAKGRGQTRGRATMYALVLCPTPDWNAAACVVWVAQQTKAEQRAAKAARKAARAAESSGDSPLNSTPGDGSGDSPPNSTPTGSGDSPPTGFGGLSPTDLGGQSPDHPGSTHELPHEMAGVGPQAEAARAPEADLPAAAPPPPRLVPPPTGGDRPQRRGGKDSSCQGQRALLLPVHTPPTGAEDQEQQPAAPTDDQVRDAIRSLGPAGAVALYGHARVRPVLAQLPDSDTNTGT
ncbi:hypothetical protein ACFVDH_22055 [Streptomyces sp. NPDC057674]|uniref:hypothetical protein n=1 Tax=Streptomyces sp. NPDC057674 TaxID=3346203 RepID=UPI0036ACE881